MRWHSFKFWHPALCQIKRADLPRPCGLYPSENCACLSDSASRDLKPVTTQALLIHVLLVPASALDLNLQEWDLLIRQARHANLLARLAATLAQHDLLPKLQAQPRSHLESALTIARRQTQAVRWEVARIAQALKAIDTPIVLLKGAAYIVRDLPAAQGRLFSDVDILVAKSQLEAVELALKIHGWITTHHDAYDQRYYRLWMHELPPMRHLKRESMLDVHHTILPPTARYHPDPQKLLASAENLDGYAPQIKTLAPIDMVLHSATHLFHEGELHHGLRDLFDLDSLLRHFETRVPNFWEALIARAADLDLLRPLYYALRYTRRILATPIPDATLSDPKLRPPSRLKLAYMDALFLRALTPPHPSCEDILSPLARLGVYVRGHWLRMPLHRLIPHLLHQAFADKQGGG